MRTLVWLSLTAALCAAQTQTKPVDARRARDLYQSYATSASDGGMAGQQIMLELRRNGVERPAALDTVFYSGDEVRLRLRPNFDGSLVLLNKGTSGNFRMIYPERGQDNRIAAGRDYTTPWFRFDARPGTETVTVIMSRQDCLTTEQMQTVQTYQAQAAGSSSGGLASAADAIEILNMLNSRALRRTRDLIQVQDGEQTFALTSAQTLSQPTAFAIELRHR